MAVVAVFSSRWQNGVYLLGHDQFSLGRAMVTVKFGVYSETGPIGSIPHARDKYKMIGVPDNALAEVDGRIVGDYYEFTDGETLIFHRRP
jgi:hypothetical protein